MNARETGPARPAETARFRLGPRLWLAWAALAWERLWPALWPAVGVAGLFTAAALLDILPDLPGWLHLIVVAAFALALAYALRRGLGGFRPPAEGQPAGRIEQASGLSHRPLATLGDDLAAGRGDPAAEALWLAHRRRALASLKRLRIGLPAPGLARLDPWALRAALLMLLVIGVTVSWGDAGNRLARAALPVLGGAGGGGPATVEVWISPPDYTGKAPRFLQAAQGSGEIIEVPAQSRVLAQLHGGSGTPVLTLGGEETEFAAMGERSFQASATVEADGRLAIAQRGREIAGWPLKAVPDSPPEIEYFKPPARSPRATLRLDFEARDDYGVTDVKATIMRLPPEDDGVPPDGEIVLDLPLAGNGRTEARGTSYHDLTAHPWAGLPVSIVLEASDAVGQTGQSDAFTMALPERIFQHPVARAIIEQRKRLTVTPGERRDVARRLRAIGSQPRHYFDNLTVYLALRSAQWRLIFDRDDAVIPSVQSLLWDTALRIEDGNLSLSERELREAEEALREALSRDASDEVLEQLMDELQRALDAYLQALAEEMRNNPDRFGFDMPLDSEFMALEAQDLRRMIERMRELSRSGAKDAARQLLQQLQSMMENLRGMARGQNQPGNNEAAKTLRDLQDIIRRQEGLLNRTFRQSQDMQSGSFPGARPNTRPGAREQERLRRDLGDVMRRLGEMTGNIPRPLGKAERAMREAFEALDQNAPGQAVGPQGRALDQLRQGGRAAAAELMRQFGGLAGQNQGRPGNQAGQNRDPFGRPIEGFGSANTSDVQIPDQPDLQRARQILDELRRRAGERGRPTDELDYIERLLRRF